MFSDFPFFTIQDLCSFILNLITENIKSQKYLLIVFSRIGMFQGNWRTPNNTNFRYITMKSVPLGLMGDESTNMQLYQLMGGLPPLCESKYKFLSSYDYEVWHTCELDMKLTFRKKITTISVLYLELRRFQKGLYLKSRVR